MLQQGEAAACPVCSAICDAGFHLPKGRVAFDLCSNTVMPHRQLFSIPTVPYKTGGA